VRKYRNIRIEKKPEKALKKISKFTFSNCKQFGDLMVFDMRKEEVKLDKPHYIGRIYKNQFFFINKIF